ncbi:MAG: amidase [Pseudomonadota bacterium]
MPGEKKPLPSDPASLLYANATSLAQWLNDGDLGARELMEATQARIAAVNPAINAICTRIPERDALQLADEADRKRASGEPLGPLHGLPIAVKDLAQTSGIRTTLGSPIFKDFIPDQDCLLVQRLKAAGALVIGKTNTPEFGVGSHTFNPLFGVTRNPWDLTKTAGGSSGGAAAALASGMLPIADGSDMGGSLRNPAAFCNVVGFRPSHGRVPAWPSPLGWQSRIGIEGPMARNVTDCALLFSVLVGADPRDPLSIDSDAASFRTPLEHDFANARIGLTPDLGFLPVEREVAKVCMATRTVWEALGFTVVPAHPDLRAAMKVFRVLRGSFYAHMCAGMLAEHRDKMKDTLIENIETGMALTAADLTQADASRTTLYQGALQFFASHDFLVLPATQVSPFPVENEWVREIEGTTLTDYLEWMSICCVISVLGLPAISVPCGFTQAGLPVGLQIVGRPGADLDVLRVAYALESALDLVSKRPSL